MPKKDKPKVRKIVKIKKVKRSTEDSIRVATRKRFTNGLSAAEAERLAWLSEECGEVIHAIGKILRHGYGSKNPDKENSRSNRMNLCEELGHVHSAIGIMQYAGDLSSHTMMESSASKTITVRSNLHHQGF